MANPNFIDMVSLYCRSGKGGDGCMHLHRAKFVPRGGPDGGDGGRGGDVILQANKNLWTLLHLKYTKHVIASDGEKGGQSRSTGKDGKDKIITVPCGTVVYNGETGEWMGELKNNNDRLTLLKGGRGGKGNWHFKTPTNQTPRYAQEGQPAKEINIILHLKLLADVGLVGMPNAGKSTLLSCMTAAKPLIADYPFTTLTPQLGIVSYKNNQSFCMADIPGIIEGASKGKGLGLQFLRHIERNAILLFLIPANTENIPLQYNKLRNELNEYNPILLEKEHILAITKTDLCEDNASNLCTQLRHKLSIPVIPISAVTNQGIDKLKDTLWTALQQNRYTTIEISHAPIEPLPSTLIHNTITPAHDEENSEPQTIILNELDEEWDVNKYKEFGWDTKEK